jgi:FlaA1/EpsC-like NDP-sugar epimerase
MIEDQQVKMFNSGIVTDRAVVRFWMDVGSACSLFLRTFRLYCFSARLYGTTL